MAAILTRRTVPNIEGAHSYLLAQGYINCGTSWLRGLRHYARLERLSTGRISIVEGVA